MTNKSAEYTTDELIDFFLQIIRDDFELISQIHEQPDKFPEIYWSPFYELEFHEHCMVALFLFGGKDYSNLKSNLVKDAIKNANDEEPLFQPSEENEKLALAALLSLRYSLRSIYIYGKSLNRLIDDSAKGDISSLRQALKIDHSCISTPILSHLLSKEELLDSFNREEDSIFYKKISNVINTRNDTRFEDTTELHFVLYLLHELGHLEKLSEKQLYQLIVKDLNIRKSTDGGSKALQQFVYRWRKKAESNFSKTVSTTLSQRIHILFCHVYNNSRSLETWKEENTYRLFLDWGLIKPEQK